MIIVIEVGTVIYVALDFQLKMLPFYLLSTDKSVNLVISQSGETIKIDSYAAYDGFHFVLDCLYSFLVRLDYDNNIQRLKENADTINKNKK